MCEADRSVAGATGELLTSDESEDASPAQANPVRPRETNGGGQSAEGAEACYRCGSNERVHASDRSGCEGRARVDRRCGTPGDPAGRRETTMGGNP
jgi:hypothetical protein